MLFRASRHSGESRNDDSLWNGIDVISSFLQCNEHPAAERITVVRRHWCWTAGYTGRHVIAFFWMV